METKKKRRSKWDHLNTPDDFNKFIEEKDIKCPSELKKKFGSVHYRAYRLGILNKLIYHERKNDWSYLNTPDDFNKFIKEKKY